MEKNLSLEDQLKMAELRKIDQMIAESFATVEKMREDSALAAQRWEEEKEARKLEQEENRKRWETSQKRWEQENERLQKESTARVAKYDAEREKAQKETKYLLFIATGSSVLSAIGIILHLLK